MSLAVIPVELPEVVLQDAVQRAEQSGVSVSEWIRRTVEQGLRDEKWMAEFERRRALGGNAASMLAILDKAPGGVVEVGDELL